MKSLSIIILTLSFTKCILGQSPSFGRCPNIKPINNLDLTRFNGTWFEVQRYYFMPEVVGKCISVKYTPLSDGTIDTKILFTLDSSSGAGTRLAFNGKTICTNLNSSSTPANMQLALKIFSPLLPTKQIQQTYNYDIIDTDYVNYIIKYKCVQKLVSHYETLWILSRDQQYTPSTRRLVMKSLQKFGIKQSLLQDSICLE